MLHFDRMIQLLFPIMLVILYCHYIFDKVFGIPIGYVILLGIIGLATIKVVVHHRIPGNWMLPFGINLFFIFIVIMSIFLGKLFEGDLVKGIFTEMSTGWIGIYVKGLNHLIPQDIPGYESTGQIVKGLMYNLTFSVMLVAFTFLFFTMAKHNNTFYKPIVKVLSILCCINAFVCIVEFFIPPVHKYLLLKGIYGTGNYFFTFRAVSLVLSVYITGFLNLILLSMCLNKFLTTLSKKWLFWLFVVFLVILISGTRVAMMAGTVMVFIQIVCTKYLKRRQKLYLFTGLGVMLVSGPLILVLIKPDILKVVGTIFTLNDSSGSAQIHVYYFLRSIDIVLNYPLGIGIGKADFGGFEASRWMNTESHIMALTMGTGIVGFFVFIILNVSLLVISRAASNKYSDLGFIFPLGCGVLFVSVINMQMYESLIPVTFLALLYAICLSVIGQVRLKRVVGGDTFDTRNTGRLFLSK